MTDSLIGGRPTGLESLETNPLRSVPAGPPAARTLIDVFESTVGRWGRRTAIDAGDGVLSYHALAGEARALAKVLRGWGIGPGDRVGIRVPSGSAELYVAILGVLHAGAAYVPVDAEDPPARAQMIWESAGACAVVGAGLGITALAEPHRAQRELQLDNDAWIIFTSGSTGTPKGVAVTHRSAAAFVDAETELWQVDSEDRVLAGLSVGFDASCEEMWLAWRHGAALVPAPRSIIRAPADLGAWLAEREVTVISTVPTLAAMWQESDLAGVRLVILGGEACPDPLAWRLAQDREVWNTYGPTEATVVTTARRLQPGQPVTIGWPLRGWEIAIVDELGSPVALGDSGELAIGGVGLGRYLDPALDHERYAALPALGWDRAYRTGDIVRETIDGLQFIGRRDDQVKLGGRRLELGEIEGQLSAVPGVQSSAATVQRTSAGNAVLVGYVVGDVDAEEVREALAQRLPEGIVPLLVPLRSLPMTAAGKLDRKALPWPPPARAPTGATSRMPRSSTGTWLAERWAEQLGRQPMTEDSDFFALGGSSLAAAKLVSGLRARFPAVAVTDVYNHRRLGELTARLEDLGSIEKVGQPAVARGWRRWGALQLLSTVLLFVLEAPPWLLAVLAADRLARIGPQVAWIWLIVGWVACESLPARALFMVMARRVLLSGLTPGRYPRHGWVFWRLTLLNRLASGGGLEGLAGTPWAYRYARLCGHTIGPGARLHTLPPPSALVTIGEDATLEPDVDLHGWWVEGNELVLDHVRIGPGARVGTHALLMPGADVGKGAEIEPGAVVRGNVPADERWAGSPAARVGQAGDNWPAERASAAPPRLSWKLLYAAGLALRNALPLLAVVPDLLLAHALGPARWTSSTALSLATVIAPLFGLTFLLSEMALIAGPVRVASRLIKPGWHPDYGTTAWALWFGEAMMDKARAALFPLYASVYTRSWLRLLGVGVGKRTEISTAVGLNRLVRFGKASFAADLATCACVRARGGWIHVAPIEIGDGTFVGNGAILQAGARVGDGALIGVLTTAPERSPDDTSWLGAPALELPRCPPPVDRSRTTDPPLRLILARGAIELVRILFPITVSIMLATGIFAALNGIAKAEGGVATAFATPPVLLGAGVTVVLFTIALKWLLMGRYGPGEHPLWSSFVWRDEIMNTAQEVLAGPWLLNLALGTPLIPLYLRLMGAKVGRDVWVETLTIVEFDAVELGDGCALNRASVVQTHLYHDRTLRIGRSRLGAGTTLGPDSHILPDTVLGDGCTVGWRSIVMWGEELPSRTSWHGAPVVAV